MKSIYFAIALAFATLYGTVALAAHPAEGGEPWMESCYDQVTHPLPEWSMNDIIFLGLGDKPNWDSLTQLEKYMVNGSRDANNGHTYSPWGMSLYSAVAAFYTEYGYVPDVFTDTEIHRVPGMEGVTGDNLEIFRNPLTGEWPKLHSTELSPGDAYMRPLTEDEKRHYADLMPDYKKHWYQGKVFDSEAFKAGADPADCWTQDRVLETPVFYVRLYGRNGPIQSSFMYWMTKH